MLLEMKNSLKNIAIIGLGLIGGSLAKVLKGKKYHITGITRSRETIKSALREKVIDKGFTVLTPNALNGVDLIILAVPLSLIKQYIKKIAAIVKRKTVLTDVGSTKSEICKFANAVLPHNILFIGGHPMAGTENAGFKSSAKNLFKDAAWVLTPYGKRKSKALNELKSLIKKTGAVPIITSSEKHDLAVALISHIPLLISSSICSVVKDQKYKELKTLSLMLASSGFRDVTRIAGGNPELSKDLIISNLNNIKKLMPLYNSALNKLLISSRSRSQNLIKSLKEISNWRNGIYNSYGKNKNLVKEN
jgi:prephenate dehydrogenase